MSLMRGLAVIAPALAILRSRRGCEDIKAAHRFTLSALAAPHSCTMGSRTRWRDALRAAIALVLECDGQPISLSHRKLAPSKE